MTKLVEQKSVYPNKDYYKDKPLAVRLGAKFFPYHDKFGAELTEFILPSFLSVNHKNLREDVDYVRNRMLVGEAMEAFGLLLLIESPFFGVLSYGIGRTLTQWAEESSLDITFKKERENDNRIRKEVQAKHVEIKYKNLPGDWFINIFPFDLSSTSYETIDYLRINYLLKTYGKDKELNAASFKFYSENPNNLEESLKEALGTKTPENIFLMDFVNTSGTSENEIVKYFRKAIDSFSDPAKKFPEEEKPLIYIISNKDEKANSRTKIIEQTGLFEETTGLTNGRKIYVLNWEKALATNNT